MDIQSLIDQNALFVINHSGGKDSQSMYLHLTRELNIPRDQVKVIHAILPKVDWPDVVDHIHQTIDHDLILVQANKTLFDMARHKGMFPSEQQRQCTSDLKRDPINKGIRHICNTEGFTTIVNCMGHRRDEGEERKKMTPLLFNEKKSLHKRKVRNWYDWRPILDYHITDVWNTIKRHGQKPFWIYDQGMRRCSCVLCIYSQPKDIVTANKLAPEIVQKFIEVEKEIGFTLYRGTTIEEILKTEQLSLFT